MDNLGIHFLDTARFDAAAIGAPVIRNDPGTKTWCEARNVNWWVSGAEFNFVANLARAFGLDTAFLTAMVSNHPLGTRFAQGVREMGVIPFYRDFLHDGKDGPNIAQTYSDRGAKGRPPKVFYNRANEAAQLLLPKHFDWDAIFKDGVRLFHTGGLFSSLCKNTSNLALHSIDRAKSAGAVCSYDINWRKRLWESRGGMAEAQKLNKLIVPKLDILIANEEDLQKGLGIPGPDVEKKGKLDVSVFKSMIAEVRKRYPNLKVIATTMREVLSPTKHRWSAIAWAEGKFEVAPVFELDVYDRIGGGDGFAAGFIYAILKGKTLEEAVLYGWAHGALVATFPGDTTMADLEMVVAFIEGGGRVDR